MPGNKSAKRTQKKQADTKKFQEKASLFLSSKHQTDFGLPHDFMMEVKGDQNKKDGGTGGMPIDRPQTS